MLCMLHSTFVSGHPSNPPPMTILACNHLRRESIAEQDKLGKMSNGGDGGWSLSAGVREETVRRVTSNLINMIFAEGGSAIEADAAKTAASIERKAYTVAQAESTTTTGARPATEVLQAYTRCCFESVIPASYPLLAEYACKMQRSTLHTSVAALVAKLPCFISPGATLTQVSQALADQGLFRQDCMCRKLATLMLDAVKAQKASQDQPAVAIGTQQVA